ncbi:MAG: hypothetical protein ACXWUH_07250 [Burkholderiales bacterium]
MELKMWRHLRKQLTPLAGLPPARLVTLFVVLLVPGGLMLPLCYVARAAFLHAASRKTADPNSAGAISLTRMRFTRFTAPPPPSSDRSPQE